LCWSFVSVGFGAELRTWTFRQDGQMKTAGGGTVSFKKGGRIEAVFVRLQSTNVLLLAAHGEYLFLPSGSFSDGDRAYLRRAGGAEDSAAYSEGPSALVKNEMSRRRLEAAGLRDQASTARHQAEVELEAARQLDSEAADLSERAANLQTQALPVSSSAAHTSTNAVAAPASGVLKVRGDSGIVLNAAKQLEQDAAKLRNQAQEKRRSAEKFSMKAVDLEETAESIEASSSQTNMANRQNP
jgi:hypothetical protein